MGLTRRRSRKPQSEFAVIGLGRFGSRLARRLSLLGHHVLGVDTDPAKVQDIADEISEALILDATNEEALAEIDLGAFQTVIITLIDEFEACTLATLAAKQMGVPNVIAVTHSDRHQEILRRLGADRVVQPIQESGDRLADELAAVGIMQSMVLTPDRQLAEIGVPRRLVGKLVASCVSQGVIVLAIIRDGAVIPNPPGQTVFSDGDLLVILGDAPHVDAFTSGS
jgi:trk system potassium uptake protein TrkA